MAHSVSRISECQMVGMKILKEVSGKTQNPL
jgi:hypothetical protein